MCVIYVKLKMYGIKIKIRAAKVHEIQAYSIISNENILDVTEKMNQMLSSCVKVTLPNGQNGSYKDIKDGDRLFIIFMIRELTFQKGNSLAKDVTCNFCNNNLKDRNCIFQILTDNNCINEYLYFCDECIYDEKLKDIFAYLFGILKLAESGFTIKQEKEKMKKGKRR